MNSLLVLMGRGLTEWLLQEGGYPATQTTFVPVRHAVPALTVEKRSVYARMKVAPGGAVPASLVRKEGSHRVKDLKTFHDVFIEREQAVYILLKHFPFANFVARVHHFLAPGP